MVEPFLSIQPCFFHTALIFGYLIWSISRCVEDSPNLSFCRTQFWIFRIQNFRSRPCLSQLRFLHSGSSDVLLPEILKTIRLESCIKLSAALLHYIFFLQFFLVDISMAFLCFRLQGLQDVRSRANWLHQIDADSESSLTRQVSKVGRNLKF